jgi:hypothetical protein
LFEVYNCKYLLKGDNKDNDDNDDKLLNTLHKGGDGENDDDDYNNNRMVLMQKYR